MEEEWAPIMAVGDRGDGRVVVAIEDPDDERLRRTKRQCGTAGAAEKPDDGGGREPRRTTVAAKAKSAVLAVGLIAVGRRRLLKL